MSYEQQANYPNVYMLPFSSLPPPFTPCIINSPNNTLLHFLPVLYHTLLARPAPDCALTLRAAGGRHFVCGLWHFVCGLWHFESGVEI